MADFGLFWFPVEMRSAFVELQLSEYLNISRLCRARLFLGTHECFLFCDQHEWLGDNIVSQENAKGEKIQELEHSEGLFKQQYEDIKMENEKAHIVMVQYSTKMSQVNVVLICSPCSHERK